MKIVFPSLDAASKWRTPSNPEWLSDVVAGDILFLVKEKRFVKVEVPFDGNRIKFEGFQYSWYTTPCGEGMDYDPVYRTRQLMVPRNCVMNDEEWDIYNIIN